MKAIHICRISNLSLIDDTKKWPRLFRVLKVKERPNFIKVPYFGLTPKIRENYWNFKILRALKHLQNLILNLDFIFAQTTQLLDSNGHHKESVQLISPYLWYLTASSSVLNSKKLGIFAWEAISMLGHDFNGIIKN